MKNAVLALLLSLFAAHANANMTCILFGDSIGSTVAQGTANQHFLHLLTAERNVFFRSVASPGATLGHSDYTGFNSQRAVEIINQVRGLYGWYGCVIIQAGTNDFGRDDPVSVTKTVESLRRILAKVRADGRKALVMEPIYRDGENTPNSVNDALCGATGNTLNCYRYFMGVVCQQEYGDVCHFAKRSNTPMGALNNNYSSVEVMNQERLHPNAVGHRKMADWIKAEAAAAGIF